MTPVSCHILLGGMVGPDGYIPLVNTGMHNLAAQLSAIPGVVVDTRIWTRWSELEKAIPVEREAGSRIAIIGYSGGGSRATWLASDLYYHNGHGVLDLIVGYDPSPIGQVYPLGTNVRAAICYHNLRPLMFGYGGGLYKILDPNTTLTVRDIAEQHMLVQYDQSLHAQTVAAVAALRN